MRAAAALAVAALVLVAAACGGARTVTQTVTVTRTHTVTTTAAAPTTTGGGASASACTGADLSGSFDVVSGSAGAGQISYRLTLTNVSKAACFVSGLPQVQLLAADGAPLPTHVLPSQPGAGTAARIVLRPGDAAVADARFSPDVPGPTEQHAGPCEPKATTLAVTVSGSSSLRAPVQPPTSVCEQGQLGFDLLRAAG